MNIKPYITVFLSGLIAGLFIMYLMMRPIDDLTPLKPVETIAAETETKAAPVEKIIAKWEGENRQLRDTAASFKAKWMAASAELKRVAKMKAPMDRMHVDVLENSENIQRDFKEGSKNGTAEDYITELQSTALTADNDCAQTIGAMERRQLKTDSLLQAQQFLSAVYKLGFNQMKEAASARDSQIKQLNKQLRWQKVQATTLKVAVIAVAAILVKNQLK